jgi:hypothetical protein
MSKNLRLKTAGRGTKKAGVFWMAKADGLTKSQGVGGPFLESAFICEELIRDKDGSYSAIRMVTRIKFHGQTFESGTFIEIPLALVVSFKAGNVTDTRHLSLQVTSPSGRREPFLGTVLRQPITFAGGDTGAFAALPSFAIKYDVDGTYWIDVFLDKKRYSSLPLTVLTNQPY